MTSGGNNVPPCRLLKDFNVSKLLGAGAFGAVIQVTNKLDGKEYAVKVAAMDSFIGGDVSREVKNLAAVPQHKNLVMYSTAWEDRLTTSDLDSIKSICRRGGASNDRMAHFRVPSGSTYLRSLCIQMELCGKDLRHWLGQQTVVKEKECVEIFLQLQSGIRHIHKHNLIHRDLKPDNIFFDKNNSTSVKIGDLGLAVAHTTTRSALHSNGTGTGCYLAPEQMTSSAATHTRYDKMVDIFASGLILLELFYPEIQASRNNNSFYLLEQTFHHLKHGRQVPSSVSANYPLVSNLILKMTESEKRNRPSFDEIFETFKKPSSSTSPMSSQQQIGRPAVVHNIKCDHCGMTPIVGIRYKCSDCVKFDLCQKCELIPGVHDDNHGMVKMKSPVTSGTTTTPASQPVKGMVPTDYFVSGTGITYRAIYSYDANDTDQATFVVGDLIENCTAAHQGWLTGTVKRTGKRGKVPDNFLVLGSGITYRAMYSYDAKTTDEATFVVGDLIEDCTPTSAVEGWLTGTVKRTGKRGKVPENFLILGTGITYRAIQGYDAKTSDQATIVVGDLIENCTDTNQSWLSGTVKRTGKRGKAPANFLVFGTGITYRAIQGFDAKTADQATFVVGDLIENCTYDIKDWLTGTVKRTGKRGRVPEIFLVLGTGITYRAIQGYDAKSADQATFVVGDLIENCTDTNQSWLSGTVKRTGKQGKAPANFLVLGTGITYRAIQGFDAKTAYQATFVVGDLIENCTYDIKGWLTGTVKRTGKRGRVPENFLVLGSGITYRAIQGFDAKTADQATFVVGDLIENCTYDIKGWLTGTVKRTGKRGRVPEIFLVYNSY